MMRRARPALGTLVEVSIGDALAPPALEAAVNAAYAAIEAVERSMSFHAAASEVSAFNRAVPGTTLALSPALHEVLSLAVELTEASDALFNIACAPCLVAWQLLPSPAPAVPEARPQDSRALLRLDAGGAVHKLAAGWIDLGGIAKGYAVDAAIAALQAAGVREACVNAGGDLRVLGRQIVALRDPRAPMRLARTIAVDEGALASSGAYFSLRHHEGRAVSALVDGRDWTPLAAPVGATVLAPRCVLADALTKIVLASGDAAHPLLARYGARALII